MWDFFLYDNIYYYMRNIIKKILRENTNPPKRILRYIHSIFSHYEGNVDDIREDLKENFNLTNTEAYTIIFEYYMSEGVDPTTEIGFEDITYYVFADDLMSILKNSGWLDTYLKDPNSFPIAFRDIEVVGERFIAILDEWSDFSCLFDDTNLADRVLNPDWAELYGWFDVDFSNDVKDNLDEKSIKHIQNYIKEEGLIGKELENNQYNISFEGEETSVLTEEMVSDVDTLLELIDEDELFYDLRNELENAYRWAYEAAGESEIFDILRDHITSLIGDKPKWDDKNKLRVDVTDIFYDFLVRYLSCKGEMPGTQENYFVTGVMCETLNCEDDEIVTPDMGYFYPDSTLVAENMNENIISNL